MPSPIAISIGNFDGVHRGHAALMASARAAVGDSGTVVAMSFDPHPRTVLAASGVAGGIAGQVPGRLSIFTQRERLLRAAGADRVCRLEPTLELLGMTPEAFIDAIVMPERPDFIVEGSDFRFGKGRTGSIETLRAIEAERGTPRVIVVDSVAVHLQDQHEAVVSSSVTRWLLAHGRVRDAARLLGRPYELECEVVSGDRRGRDLGVPTVNLAHGDYQLPADGIYAGQAARVGPDTVEPEWTPAAISVGVKPTFGASPRCCEAHLIGVDAPLDDYGWTVRLRFTDWLRDQIRYDTVEALVEQLDRDIEQARARGVAV